MGRDKTTKKIIFLPFLDNGTVLWMADLLIFLSTSDYAAYWHCYLYFWIHHLNLECVMNTLSQVQTCCISPLRIIRCNATKFCIQTCCISKDTT